MMWMAEPLYDLVVVIGYNTDPVVPGRGSAIFLHVAREDFTPTAGCIAIPREALARLLGLLGPGSTITIRACQRLARPADRGGEMGLDVAIQMDPIVTVNIDPAST